MRKILITLAAITVVFLFAVYYMISMEVAPSAFLFMVIFLTPTVIGVALGAIWLKMDLKNGKGISVRPYQVGIPGCLGMAMGIFLIDLIWNIL